MTDDRIREIADGLLLHADAGLLEFAFAIRRETLEQAAIAAWSVGMDLYGPFVRFVDLRDAGSQCAKAIRALKEKSCSK